MVFDGQVWGSKVSTGSVDLQLWTSGQRCVCVCACARCPLEQTGIKTKTWTFSLWALHYTDSVSVDLAAPEQPTESWRTSPNLSRVLSELLSEFKNNIPIFVTGKRLVHRPWRQRNFGQNRPLSSSAADFILPVFTVSPWRQILNIKISPQIQRWRWKIEMGTEVKKSELVL